MEGWWVYWIGILATILTSAITYFLKRIVDYVIVRFEANDLQKQALQALLEGTAIAQEQFVRAAKAAATDGRLSDDEIARAKAIAWEHAKTIATGPVKDIVVSWSADRVSSLIKQLLEKKGVGA